ncbi:MAG: type VI secretion system baseplate subunit TssG [Alphaproteobacteria bacterium]
MATTSRRATTPVTRKRSLVEQVFAEGYEFDFSQVVTILETLRPGAISLGEGSSPRQEALRISSRTTLSVSASEVQKVTAHAQKTPQIYINFLGIAGVQGPLPPPFAEMIIDRLRSKDTGIQDFLDIFNHRLASMWYRSRKKIVPGMEKINPIESPIGRSLLDLIGLFTPELRQQWKVQDRSLLSYAGLLWKKPRSALGLEQILQAFFATPVQIQQFAGKWQRTDAGQQTQIGVQEGHYNRLGRETILGSKSWDQEDGITVVIGPVSWELFLGFLPVDYPGNDNYTLLKNWLSIYCDGLLTKRIRVLLKPKQIRSSPLGSGLRLGLTSWLTVQPQSPAFTRVRSVSFR